MISRGVISSYLAGVSSMCMTYGPSSYMPRIVHAGTAVAISDLLSILLKT